MSFALRGISGHLSSSIYIAKQQKLELDEKNYTPELQDYINRLHEKCASEVLIIPVSPQPEIKNMLEISESKSGNLSKLREILESDKTKKILNYVFNGSAACGCLIAFLNGNFYIIDVPPGTLEAVSETLTKAAVAETGLVGAVNFWQKRNVFSFVAYAMNLPISFLASGYNLWLARGFCSGLGNAAIIIDQREVVDEKGEPVLDENGNKIIIGGDFKNKGWLNGFKTTCNESIKMLKELLKKPSRIKNFSHAALFSSIFQMIAPIPGFFGFVTTEAVLRDASAVSVDASYLLHKNIKNNTNDKSNSEQKINLKSPVVQSSLLWIGTAVVDLFKRFSFISEGLSNLTHLSLFFDRTASIRYTQGIIDIKKDTKKPS